MNSPLMLAGVVLLILMWRAVRAHRRGARRGRAAGWESAYPRSASPPPGLPTEVERGLQDMLARRNKINAIKLVRTHTGWGLRESKQYVEWRLDPRRPPPAVPPIAPSPDQSASPDLEAEARALVASGNPIEAVKRVHERTGWSLKESMDYVKEVDQSGRVG